MRYCLSTNQTVYASLEDVWDYFASPSNLNDLTPPSLNLEIMRGADCAMFQGQLIEYRVQFMPFISSLWITEITHVERKVCFVDEQIIGPYHSWSHEHHFAVVDHGTRISDKVTYEMPAGPLGDLVHTFWIKRKLEEIFSYRRQKVEAKYS